MANIVQITKIVDNQRSAYFAVYLKSDGSAGELKDYVIVDPNVDLVPSMGKGMKLTLQSIWTSLAGFDIVFKFDDGGDNVDWPVWVIPAEASPAFLDFTSFGGLRDRSGIDASGKLLISTNGFTSTADQGSFVIKVLKTPKAFVNP